MPYMDFTDEGSAIVGRLSIEIPEDADQTLNQVKSAIGDIRTELEASSRFMKNFMEYLEKVPEIAKITAQFQEQELTFLRNKLNLESQIADAQNRGNGGGRSSNRRRGVQTDPRGNLSVDTEGEHDRREEENRRTQNQFPQFSGDLPRSGSVLRNQHFDVKYGDLTNSQSWAPFAGSLPEDRSFSGTLRPSSEIPISPTMQSMLDYRQRLGEDLQDPRLLFEHLRQRGMVTEGVAGGAPSYSVSVGGKRFSADELMMNPQLQSFVLDHLARTTNPSSNENGTSWRQTRALGFSALNAMRMMGPGTTIGQNVAGIGGLLGSVGRVASGFGLGSLGTGLLIGGGALGVGAGILGAVEEGGEMYQNVKNIGQLHNQGFGGGFGYEMGMRMMALNPFITTEQARQIMMGGLTLGYTGKEFDTVTEFMAPQPHSAQVLTPHGFIKMEELSVGDQVIGADGKPTIVRAIQEWGNLEIFELTVQGGLQTRCASSHKWAVYDTGKELKIKTVEQMLGSSRRNKNNKQYPDPLWFNAGKTLQPRYRIPLVEPVDFPEKNLPLDPYLIGLLLGDGSLGVSLKSGRVRLYSYEEEYYKFDLPKGIDFYIRPFIRNKNDNHHYKDGHEYVFTAAKNGNNTQNIKGRPVHPLKVILHDLGLLGCLTEDKFIPREYLLGSVVQRHSLLQGLIDTDGCITENGSVSFSNTCKQLIDDVVFLVHSLGGKTTVGFKDPTGHAWGSKRIIYSVGIILPPNLPGPPAKLMRKASRYRSKLTTDKRRARGIISIKSIGFEECRCINVDGGLYVTDDFIITHNSNLKDMNLQVADSVKLVQQNVQQGGQAIGGLASQLTLLQQLSGSSSQTNQQAQQKFIQTSGSLINQGVTGEVSGQVATQLGQWFQQPINGQVDPLAQIGGQLTNQAINSPQFQQQMIALGLVPPNTLPQEAVQASGANLPQNLQKVFQFYASQAAAGGSHAPVLFQQMLSAAGINLNLTQATQLYGRMVGPSANLPTTRANQAISQAESTTLNQDLLTKQRGGTNPLSTAGHDIVNFFQDVVGQGQGGWSKNPTQQRMDADAAAAAAGRYSNPILNQLVQQYGAGDLVVYDPQGNPHKIDYNNQAMMMGIGNGSWKIAFARTDAEKKAMEGTSQQWIAGARALGAAGNEGTLNQWANNEVQTNKGAVGLIGLTPDAQKLITFLPNQGNVPNDPGTIAANAGLNGAQPNNNPFTPYGGY